MPNLFPPARTTAIVRIAFSALVLSTQFAISEPHSFFQKHRHLFDIPVDEPALTLIAGWDSHYVTEGRDNLEGEGLTGFTTEFEAGGLLLGTWIANNGDINYREQNFYAEYGFSLENIDAYIGYNHLRFDSDRFSDNDLGFGLSLPTFPLDLNPAIDWYYSVAAGGSFFELSLSREIELSDRTTLLPKWILGANDGYIAEGHNGLNHTALQIGLSHEITKNLSLDCFLTQQFALDADAGRYADDAILIDLLHTSIALAWTF